MGRTVGVFSAILAASFCAATLACASEPLILVDELPTNALFVGSKDEGTLEFQIGDETRTVSRHNLIRWSNPPHNRDHQEVILVDGSRLVLAESWAGKKSLQVSADTVTVLTEQFGKAVFPRSKLRAVLLSAPKNSLRRLRLRDQLLALPDKTDRLWLTNGDTLAGQLLEIGQSGSTLKFALEGSSEPISLPVERLAGLALRVSSKPTAEGNLVVGWRDGSSLAANSLVTENGSARIELACQVTLTATALRDVVYLQSLKPQAIYLSDLEATDYRHEPFLNIPWKYRRDRNLRGGPLLANHLIYAKGLAMHSASRLTYDLPEKSFHRFVAQVAIDSSANDLGSVVFQVFLRQADQLQLALTTPVVRCGEAPLPISVALDGADQIVLAVEYADRGDQGDDADWLEARLE